MATITPTITDLVTKTGASASASSTMRAAAQGGILDGGNPSQYNASNPIILFIIQAGIILIFCRLLHYPLALLRQPRVIAEVLGGILLGPSVMGRIPGFTKAIFPTPAMPGLSLVANLGLILFLFLVGLEVDLRYFVSNWKVAVSVGAAGMALPFGLGCAIARGLYNDFQDEPGTVPIEFGTYMLFIAVAMSITAFPVLCRILTELKLMSTPVGVIGLSAGVGNDVVGWILLALCVALVNAGDGLTALWVLLTCLGYVLFLVFAVRPVFMRVLRRTRSLQDGPSQSVVALTLLIALASAFFTGVIGVHPIFGAFLAGLICPHEGGFAIKVTEKVEDLVGALFLPLYFALSGLSTNLGLLDNGITWADVVGVIAIAFVSNDIVEKKHPIREKESTDYDALQMMSFNKERPVEVHGVRLVEVTNRTSTVMKVSEADEYSLFDPVLNAFKVLGQLYNLAVSGEVAVVPAALNADTLVTKADEESADLLLLPWSETGSMSESQTISTESVRNKLASDMYSAFIAQALETAKCHVAVFINRGFTGSLKQKPSTMDRKMSTLSVRSQRDRVTAVTNTGRSHHIFLPFFGGADGRLAVRLALQLAEHPEVTATIVHFRGRNDSIGSDAGSVVAEQIVVTPKKAETQPGQDDGDAAFFALMQRSLPAELENRVVFDSSATAAPLSHAIASAQEELGQDPKNGGDLMLLGRYTVLAGNAASDKGCLGVAADMVLESGIRASVLVVQARS
ncbi:hypothetical protein B0A54_05962 [Friedmanniomyces endolithicus]|uniref:Cation/H+ exchanger transmembrane domain-containing protein n=1 Tax=Friedmanniomyces endolithicus TaxID=329885 RepID=A0A4U0V354_9PEZI|nr:hypothetical protein LTS09_006668 [Friedmanniomyces endolithicus]TKA43014.1 hypothetical protein B0A54_05962 [Friedmanniomyces endolithicus]